MRPVIRVSAVVAIALVLVVISCRKEGDAKSSAQVVKVAQDTMLLHDLAEANKNTAAAASLDNSLGTVKTNPDGSALISTSSQPTPTNRVVPRTTSETQTTAPTPSNTPRMTAPTQASDAHPTTVPLSRSPANNGATRSSGGAPRSSGDPCDSPTTIDQRACLFRSIASNDVDLNSTYQDLLAQARKSGGSDLEDRFRQSQRDWVNKRDSDCTAQTPSQGNRLWARDRARCFADYSSRRTAELRANLSNLRGQ